MVGEPNTIPVANAQPAAKQPVTQPAPTAAQPAAKQPSAPVIPTTPQTTPVNSEANAVAITVVGEPKKSILKKWWFWVIVGVVIVVLVMGGIMTKNVFKGASQDIQQMNQEQIAALTTDEESQATAREEEKTEGQEDANDNAQINKDTTSGDNPCKTLTDEMKEKIEISCDAQNIKDT